MLLRARYSTVFILRRLSFQASRRVYDTRYVVYEVSMLVVRALTDRTLTHRAATLTHHAATGAHRAATLTHHDVTVPRP